MFKVNALPSISDDPEVIADYLELQAVLSSNHKISARKAMMDLLKSADEFEESGVDQMDEKVNSLLEGITEELVRRDKATGYKYPFDILYNGTVIQFRGFNCMSNFVYVFLLFATRFNMRDNKVFCKIDGTQVFERLSAEVAGNYFGPRSNYLVFGTAVPGGFQEKVNHLCRATGEGLRFDNRTNEPVDENDDKVDIVVWISFADQRQSKFWGFGQCKTGTNWEPSRFQLQPIAFCKKWFFEPITVEPIRMFFIADVVEGKKWIKRSMDVGVLFDRVRIMNYLPDDLPTKLFDDIVVWVRYGLNAINGKKIPKKRAA